MKYVKISAGVERRIKSLEQSDKAVKFIESAPISASDKEKICYDNTEKLLNL